MRMLTKTFLVTGRNRNILLQRLKKYGVSVFKIQIIDEKRAKITIDEKDTPKYEIQKVRNPFRVSEGVTSLFGKGESNKSMRELAQMHKVWDSENEKWLDYTAED